MYFITGSLIFHWQAILGMSVFRPHLYKWWRITRALRIRQTTLPARSARNCLRLISGGPPPHVHATHPDEDDILIPDPPTTCCMSGCSHCVWIEYAEELARLYKDGGKAAEKVMRAIEDPSLRIFMSVELRDRLTVDEENH